MIKCICDKCGKEIQSGSFAVSVECPMIRSWGDDYVWASRDFHFCKGCMKKIRSFIEEKRTDCPSM